MSINQDDHDIILDDIRHLLEWLGLALFMVGVVATIRAVIAVTDDRWVAGCLNAGAAVVFYVSWFRTESRAASYRVALRMRARAASRAGR
ncbi:hypothetical protein ACIRON_02860 [Nocardioides sp. NPDC101246]|uniref:hypothetical protein n=1 Tax=Nocardioides sp. NPDC101246 TaxID=3364336 RepID=UPI00381357BD